MVNEFDIIIRKMCDDIEKRSSEGDEDFYRTYYE